MMSLRTELADARTELREAQDAYEDAKAQAEQRIIDAAGGAKHLGANAEDRARALTLALQDDEDHLHALVRLREAQARVDVAQALLDDAIDARRSEDRASRDRASAALERLAEVRGPSVPVAVAAEITAPL